MSDDLNEVDFGGAEGLPKLLAAAVLAPAYFSWSKGVGRGLSTRAGRFGESGVALRRRAEAAAGTLLASCEEGGQVCFGCVGVLGCGGVEGFVWVPPGRVSSFVWHLQIIFGRPNR